MKKELVALAHKLLDRIEGNMQVMLDASTTDPVASAYVRRIRNEADGLVEYLRSRGDAVSVDKGDRVSARIYKPLRQIDGIINGFNHE